MNLIRYISYLSFFSTISFAKSYSIDEVKIESVIKKNGVVEFIEKRTFNFRGKYSYVYQDIPKNYFSEIFDIQVSEEGKSYLNDNSSDPYTFQIIENKKFFRIKWFHESIDIKKQFQLSYKIGGSLKIGTEDSQFYWPYIGKNWKKSNYQVSIVQRFEKNIPFQDIWCEANSKKKILKPKYVDDSTFKLEVSRIRKNNDLNVNTIFPTSYLQDPFINDSKFNKFEYLELRKLKREKSALGFNIALAMVFASFISLVFQYLKYGKEYRISESIYDITSGFPSEHHPSLVSYLITRQKVSGLAILASILDLSRRGYFKIEEIKIKKKSIFGNKTEKKIQISSGDTLYNEENDKWDKTVFEFVKDLTEKSPQYLDGVFGKMANKSVFMSELKTSVDKKLKNFEWIEYPPRSATLSFAILNFILFATSLILLTYNIPTSIIASLAISFFGIYGAIAINRMTPGCSALRKKWKEFSVSLSENSAKYKYIDSNRLLQYSIVLGIKNERMKDIIRNFNFNEGGEFHWFYAGDSGGSGLDSFSSMIDTGSTLSASFGSDGGGGGGGGGGAG